MNNKSGSEPTPIFITDFKERIAHMEVLPPDAPDPRDAEIAHLQKLVEEHKGEVAELKFLLMQTEAELTLRNGQLEKVRFQSDIYAKQVVLKEELINERSAQLAEQTERVKKLEIAMTDIRGLHARCQQCGITSGEDECVTYQLAEQALNQESLGDGGKGE